MNFLPLIAIAALPLLSQVSPQTVRDMAANSWLQVPNTKLRALDPCPARDCSYSGVSGLAAVIYAWCGGAYDTKRDRLIVWGGGHNDYRGNEIYLFDVATLKWIRFTEPTVNPVNCGQTNADGTPNSRHTWSGLEYIDHADRFFASGGALNCNAGGCGADKTWAFDFDQKKWNDRLPSGTKPPTGCGNACAYDPNSKRVFWGDNNYPGNGAGMYSYNYEANTWAKHSSTGFYSATAVVDPKRKLLFFLGGQGAAVTVFDIGNNNYTPQTWATSGGSSLLGKNEVGAVYDPVSDKIVCWAGGSVHALDPGTKAWTAYSPAGAPDSHIGGASQSTGINGRWRYVPSLNAFIVVTSIDDDVYFYKLTAGGGTGLERREKTIVTGLLTASPNPVTRGRTWIQYTGTNLKASLRIFDASGRRVSTPAGNKNGAGLRFAWETSELPAGLYLAKIQAGDLSLVQKIVLSK